MKSIYTVQGMTCEGCKAKIEYLFSQNKDIKVLEVNLSNGKVMLESEQKIALSALQELLLPYPKYQVTEFLEPPIAEVEPAETRTWLQIYTPILLVFGYISLVSVLLGHSSPTLFMRVFMAGFFLVFSFFKLLNLKGFAESYAMYDIVAMRWQSWGIVYAFLELGLGIAYTLNFAPIFTNAFAFFLMSVSLIGVLKSVWSKQKIRCACLGAGFNLPMSTVTIIEDALMIVMSAAMLFCEL